MKTLPNVALITRIKYADDAEKPDFHKLISSACQFVENIFVLGPEEMNEENIPESIRKKVKIVWQSDPISPISMNSALERIQQDNINLDYFIVASKEVIVSSEDFSKLINIMQNNSFLLVAGYRFQLKDKSLDYDLKKRYRNKDLIAFRVPWNTCAIWNYRYFKKYVSCFDEITLGNSGDLKGMEDGLAIAKASMKNPKLKFHLIQTRRLDWKIGKQQKDKDSHIEKICRKEESLRTFMKDTGCTEDALLQAEVLQLKRAL
jgi:hypothetical protein